MHPMLALFFFSVFSTGVGFSTALRNCTPPSSTTLLDPITLCQVGAGPGGLSIAPMSNQQIILANQIQAQQQQQQQQQLLPQFQQLSQEQQQQQILLLQQQIQPLSRPGSAGFNPNPNSVRSNRGIDITLRPLAKPAPLGKKRLVNNMMLREVALSMNSSQSQPQLGGLVSSAKRIGPLSTSSSAANPAPLPVSPPTSTSSSPSSCQPSALSITSSQSSNTISTTQKPRQGFVCPPIPGLACTVSINTSTSSVPPSSSCSFSSSFLFVQASHSSLPLLTHLTRHFVLGFLQPVCCMSSYFFKLCFMRTVYINKAALCFKHNQSLLLRLARRDNDDMMVCMLILLSHTNEKDTQKWASCVRCQNGQMHAFHLSSSLLFMALLNIAWPHMTCPIIPQYE